ncbi:MAG: glycosyltransferase, partial [Microbacteriaceae bacterium]
MRIAIVSDYYLDYVGGAQTSMRAQRAALEAAGHEVLMIAPERAARRHERHPGGLALHPSWTVPGLRLPVLRDTAALRALIGGLLTGRGVEVVHLQSEFGVAHAATAAARAAGIPVVHTVHTFYWQSTGVVPTLAAPLVGLFLRLLLGGPIGDTPLSARPADSMLRNVTLGMAELADVVVSPSAHQARDLTAALVERPVAVVPNPVPPAGRATSPP